MITEYIGLTDDEVAKSYDDYGNNKLTFINQTNFFTKFISKFNDPIIKILLVALLIYFILALFHRVELYEALILGVAILLATFVGAYAEHKNSNAFAKLQDSASKIISKVYRNNQISLVNIDDIVTGDVILLQPGDLIPADGFLLEGSIKVDQSSLNGESEECLKIKNDNSIRQNKDIYDKYNLFRGSMVLSDEGVMKVTSVGKNTIFGEIATDLQVEDMISPLKIKLIRLAALISRIGYGSAFIIALVIMFQSYQKVNDISYFSDINQMFTDLLGAFIISVIIIVVAVPEGLPLMIAVVLSLNASRMYKDNVLVRKSIGVETAGSLNILFTDKTGTITKGNLEVVSFIDCETNSYNNYLDMTPTFSKLFIKSVVYNTNAIINKDNTNITNIIGGNQTERAILKYLGDVTYDYNITIIDKMPFKSELKYSSSYIDENGEKYYLIKGAPEKILENSKYYYNSNGQLLPFSSDIKANLNNMINNLASKQYRLVALATSNSNPNNDSVPLNIIGLFKIRDEIRSDAIDSIKQCIDAHIQVVMITGDRKETALAIAKESCIFSSKKDIVLTSKELNEMSDDLVKKHIQNIKVVARALPSDKLRLVKLSQELGLVVGMTGDGINDSPALKKADVGFAMGSGTEVAKDAAEIVILDDNFKSIVTAILYGRTIYHSIQKFIIFQLTINFAALSISMLGPILDLETPLTVTQILWINLIMDTLAAIAFGYEPPLNKYMQEKPKQRDENIVSPYMKSAILVMGISITILSIIFLTSSLSIKYFESKPILQSAYFNFFIFFSLVNAFNTRTKEYNIFENINLNRIFIIVMVCITIIQILLTYFGGSALRTTPLEIKHWLVIIPLSLSAYPIDLLRKYFYKKRT